MDFTLAIWMAWMTNNEHLDRLCTLIAACKLEKINLSDNYIVEMSPTYWEKLRYLAAQYSPEQFWSDDAKRRSKVESWMDWLQTTLHPDFLTGVFWGRSLVPTFETTCRVL